MEREKTSNVAKSDEPRTPEEVTDFNDRVWDMVLRKIHVVAFYVFLQIVLVSFFQTHPAYRNWRFWVYTGQFLGAWCVFYDTLLRDMGFRAHGGLVLMFLSVIALVPVLVHDPRAWDDSQVRGLLLSQIVPGIFLWGVTLVRWRILKSRYLEARREGLVP